MASLKLSFKDFLFLIAITILWGLNWPIMKAGVREMAPMTFRCLCMVGGLGVLALLISVQKISYKVEKSFWNELFWLAMTNMVCWYLLSIYGVKLLSSGRAAILGYTLPIWTALLGVSVFKGDEKASVRLLWGVLAAAIGVAFLIGGEVTSMAGKPLGAGLMLGAAFTWALGTHLLRRRKQKTHVLVITFWSLLLSLFICGLFSIIVERDQWVRPPNSIEWGAIAFNAVIVFGFCQVVWFRLASILPPVASGLSVMLIPVIGLFSGMVFLGEVPHWQDFVALVCILLAIATVLWPSAKTPV